MRPAPKQDKLFFKLIKSYVFFAFTLGVINLALLLLVLDTENEIIEITLPWLLLLGLLFSMNVYIYSRWTAKRITRPLESIAAAIRRMEKGHYTERLDITAGYEFSVIQQRFNDMAERLERTEEENHRLQASKQRMLADLSHDLKTPITTIQGYAKALQLGMVDNEAQKERILQLIYTKSTLVTTLVDDIFNLSKLDRPDYPLVAMQGDLAELLREIAADYYDQFEDKQFTLLLDIPHGEVLMDYDSNLMRRAISNLLSNALLHNPPGTEVSIRLSDADDTVRLFVIDNGVGISDQLKRVIFDPFVRGDAARQGDGGTGLGLAIARQTLELHGGELNLHNQHGKTEFELVLYKKRKSTQ
ncbi:hypothetical protein GCM10010912_36950 [Paenibacillus albidus]|uniref:histidine kinase n=1 Tax=Paenibacillus albidus TaxID=2041023 RepID=A0A917CI80_9BACL|nr:HAMP domain-containing sensor histidine kinase [Paenibacillus albidus]GGF88281.1 hypothetical protein GCM10010912_36950 [Paenibacillus albidus]